MKTLKQRLQEATVICFAANNDIIEMLSPEDVLKVVREWLEQKRKLTNKIETYDTQFQIECKHAKVNLIDELLEELQTSSVHK